MKSFILSAVTALLTTTTAFSIEYITWDHVNQNIANMCAEIEKDEFDVLLGVCAGGLPPVTMFSKYLDNKNIQVITTSSYSDDNQQHALKIWNYPAKEALEGKRILIVDDIADSGMTIMKVKEILAEKYAASDIKIATVFVNPDHCKCWPDYFAEETTEWIVFPWEILLDPK